MTKADKIYKPGEDEILKNVLNSFEVENIHVSYSKAKRIFAKALKRIKKMEAMVAASKDPIYLSDMQEVNKDFELIK